MEDPRQTNAITFFLTPLEDPYRQTFADLSYLDNNEVILNSAATATPAGQHCGVDMTIMRLYSTG
jgi:hypothetical protein